MSEPTDGAAPGSQLPTLTLYTRAGCHLCEQAEHHLNLLAFAFQPVDIRQSPDLQARYGHDVPVLALGGRTLLKGVMSRNRLSLLKIQLVREYAAT